MHPEFNGVLEPLSALEVVVVPKESDAQKTLEPLRDKLSLMVTK